MRRTYRKAALGAAILIAIALVFIAPGILVAHPGGDAPLGSFPGTDARYPGVDPHTNVLLERLVDREPMKTWSASFRDIRIDYHLVDLHGLPALGYARPDWTTGTCHVYLDPWLDNRPFERHLEVVLHEVGHCVDLFALQFDHNGFGNEGCLLGEYYCRPEEGFAETWKNAYLATCGPDPVSIGYEAGEPTCAGPDPRSVTPGRVAEFRRAASDSLESAAP